MGKKYLETKKDTLESSVLGVWKTAVEEGAARMDGRTAEYRNHRKKLESARQRRESKKVTREEVEIDEILEMSDEDFDIFLETLSDEEILGIDEGIGSFIKKRTGLGFGGKVARAKHLKTKATKAQAKSDAIKDIDTHKKSIAKSKQDTKDYKAKKKSDAAGGDDSEPSGPAAAQRAADEKEAEKSKTKKKKEDDKGETTTSDDDTGEKKKEDDKGETPAEKKARENEAELEKEREAKRKEAEAEQERKKKEREADEERKKKEAEAEKDESFDPRKFPDMREALMQVWGMKLDEKNTHVDPKDRDELDKEADAKGGSETAKKMKRSKEPAPNQMTEAQSGDKEAYKKFFDAALKKFKVSSPADFKSDEEKKKFYDYIDKGWKGDNEKAEGAMSQVREFKMQSLKAALAQVWGMEEGKNPFKKIEDEKEVVKNGKTETGKKAALIDLKPKIKD